MHRSHASTVRLWCGEMPYQLQNNLLDEMVPTMASTELWKVGRGAHEGSLQSDGCWLCMAVCTWKMLGVGRERGEAAKRLCDSDSDSNNDEGAVNVLPVHMKSSASSYLCVPYVSPPCIVCWQLLGHILGTIQWPSLPKTSRLCRNINFGLQLEYRGTLYIRKRSCFRGPRGSSRHIRSTPVFPLE